MIEEEARKLLKTVMCKEIAKEEAHDAIALLAELKRLSLAVSQAAVYVRRIVTPISEYLSMLSRRLKIWEVLSRIEFN